MDFDYLPLNPFTFDIQYESPHIQINRTDSQSSHDAPCHQPTELCIKAGDGKVEDRRRRNTEASARFRIKKKIHEKALENTVREMTAKSNVLEHRIKELEFEANWLRNLLVERDQFDAAAFL